MASPAEETTWKAACHRCRVILIWNRKPGQPFRMDVAKAKCPRCRGVLDQRVGYLQTKVRVRRDQIGL